MRAVSTTIDFSVVNRLAARRRAAQTNADLKLALLKRLTRQFVAGTLPCYSESSIEQSWNEQLFAAVLGYQTQFSHDRLPFHMKAKNFQAGYFSDFSLGQFGVGVDKIVASAELKGALVDLDKPQGAKYGHLTPVQQAVRTARAQPGCEWVLVSNFVELRLYRTQNAATPVVHAWLPDVSGPLELARLEAVLDRKALLGDRRHPGELLTVMSAPADHPASIVEPANGEYRVVLRFTPQPEQEIPLFKAERGLLDAVTKAPGWFRLFEPPNFGRSLLLRSKLADGWVAVDGGSDRNGVEGRVAISLLGQVQASFRFRALTHRFDQVQGYAVEFGWILNCLRFFGGLLDDLHAMTTLRGLFAAELREVRDKFMDVPRTMLIPGAQNSGVAENDEILAGDFAWDGRDDTLANLEGMCACELAAYFRGVNSGIGASLDAVVGEIEQSNLHDLSATP
ncbi:MAG: hypothetical protein AB7K71_23560 [Polyangiaceae bacterium]